MKLNRYLTTLLTVISLTAIQNVVFAEDAEKCTECCSQKETKLFQIQNEIFTKYQELSEDLEALGASEISFPLKNAKLQTLITPIQMNVLKDHGYEFSVQGLLKFTQEFADLCDSNSELTKLNLDMFDYLSQRVFNMVGTSDSMSKEVLDSIMEELTDFISNPGLAQEIKDLMDGYPADLADAEKAEKLMLWAYEKETPILAKYGYEGDEGRLQLSRAMIEHYYGAPWKKKLQKAQTDLLENL